MEDKTDERKREIIVKMIDIDIFLVKRSEGDKRNPTEREEGEYKFGQEIRNYQ